MSILGIVLAAGSAKRMKNDIHKSCLKVGETSVINRILKSLIEYKIDDIIVVIGDRKEQLIEEIKYNVIFKIQEVQLGTANAIVCAISDQNIHHEHVIIVPGDTVIIDEKVLNLFINEHLNKNNDLTIMTSISNKYNKDFGRIIRKDNKIVQIKEYNEWTFGELNNNEINTGIYLIKSDVLLNNINKIKLNNISKEYYFTDIISLLSGNYNIGSVVVTECSVLGINDIESYKLVCELIEKNKGESN